LARAGEAGRAEEPADEATLVALARRGDDRAFEQLYRRHVGRVYALVGRLVDDAREADELTQDVFVRVWQRLATFRGESAFGTWLHRLAVNVVLSDRRSAWRRIQRVTPAGDLIELETAESPPDPGLKLDLEQAIAALPPGARTVFVLYAVEGYRHEEIARLTGIAPGTSKAQLFRARRLLQKALA
jgi:RNA polymerase sigma-70 factor (ECF subfamily)